MASQRNYKSRYEIAQLVILVLLIMLVFSHFKSSNLESKIESLQLEVEELEEELFCEADSDTVSYMDFERCHYCDTLVPEELMFIYNDKNVCPECVYSVFCELISDDIGRCYQCRKYYYYNESYGLGLCHECGRSSITECVFCGNPTISWSENDWYAFCPSCMGYAINNSDILDSLEKLKE